MSVVKEIPVVTSCDFSDFEKNYLHESKPVILKNAIKDWPAFKKWDSEYLLKTIGDVEVGYKHSKSHLHPNPKSPDDTQCIKSTFKDYMKKINEGDGSHYFLSGDEVYFYREGNINEKLELLYNDFKTPSCIPEKDLTLVGLWLTAKKASSWLHYDGGGECNLNAQVRGSKTVYMYEPTEAKNLYMLLGSRGERFNFSNVDYQNPDLDMYPLYDQATCYKNELEEGDMLFLPKYWIHTFDHTGDLNINVNFWWNNNIKPLNSLSARDNFLKKCRHAYDFIEERPESYLGFIKLLEENKDIQSIIEKVERSYFAA